MQRAIPNRSRIRIFAAAFAAVIATAFIVPSIDASTQIPNSVAYHTCPPMC